MALYRLWNMHQRTQGAIKGFIPRKVSKLDFTKTDAEYVANLLNINMWLQTCDSAVYYMVCYIAA